MGVNWDSGVLFWKDHTPSASERYTMSHLHPFRQRIELPATDKLAPRVVDLHVCFGLHTFTRTIGPYDESRQLYRDNRETRTFCPTRYRRSFELPAIIRTLEARRCEFARGMSGMVNYVTVETADGERYARGDPPKTRNPAFGGVSSFRIRLPATGADLLQGGRAPSRFLCTGIV
jgi:hypothetical protein